MKCILNILLIGILSLNLICTISNTNLWPFCSYNMFNFNVEKSISRLKISICEDTGECQIVNPGNILPIEFFRANRFFSSIYLKGSLNNEFKKKVLLRLNNNPWGQFDEIMPAALPKYGNSFVDFQIIIQNISIDQ